jgi:hypothetical protein
VHARDVQCRLRHPVFTDRALFGSAVSLVARLLDRDFQRAKVEANPLDGRPPGREVDRCPADPLDLRDSVLDPVDAGGAVHPFDL